MKLNEEQCSNLPFPVGCRVWYNMKLDVFQGISTKVKEGEKNDQYMEQKWGALLNSSKAEQQHAAAAAHSYEALVFDRGVVSAV